MAVKSLEAAVLDQGGPHFCEEEEDLHLHLLFLSFTTPCRVQFLSAKRLTIQ